MPRALISLGSNVGDRTATLTQALHQIRSHPAIRLQRVSRFLATRPIGGPEGQPEFLNAAALLDTTLSPKELLQQLQRIEQQFGRVREVRWDQRTLDLDLLLYDDLIWDDLIWDDPIGSSSELVIPHPRLAWRGFALHPAAEIAPDWRHPVIGSTLAELAQHLRFAPNYLAISGGNAKRTQDAAVRLARELTEPSSTAHHFEVPTVLLSPPGSEPTRGLLESDSGSEKTDLPPGLRSLRAQALALRQAMTSHWNTFPRNTWLISDFWLPDRLLQFPHETSSLLQGRELPDPYLAALAQVDAPKLLIWLEEEPRTKQAREHHENAVRNDLLRHCHRGPRLVGRVGSWPELLVEVQAALEAMHDQPSD
jgi:2-amino-4-hydroxy-6-hydroxymethyldihydropteridine diphosphokinase